MENLPMPYDPSANNASLVVVCWGEPVSVGRQIDRLAADVGQVLVIDPFPAAGNGCLHVAFRDHPAIEWLESTLADVGDQIELIRYAHPHLWTCSQATEELARAYPNVIERERVQVAAMGSSDLKAHAAAMPDPLHLVIDTPGGEEQVLAVLARSSLLDRAVSVSVRCGADVFFNQAASSGDVVRLLEAALFERVGTIDDDPDWPELLFRPDENARRFAALEAALATAEVARDELLTETRHLSALLDARGGELQQAQEALRGAEAAHDQARGEIGRLSGQLDETRAALEGAKAELEAERTAATALKASLTEAEGARDQAQASLEDLSATRDRLKAENERLGKVRDETRAALEGAKAELEAERTAATALKDSAAQLNKDKNRAEETLRVRTAELEREEEARAGHKEQLALARDEIRRLEGQVALIQNLLLRQREF